MFVLIVDNFYDVTRVPKGTKFCLAFLKVRSYIYFVTVITEEIMKNELLPERHPNHDFFIADIFDNLPFKDDMATMTYPIFTLSKKPDFRCLSYKKGDISIEISPSVKYGLPTIFDKDVFLYCGSLLMEQVNKGIVPPKTIRISTHDLLVTTNRLTTGKGYKYLKKALDRLQSVTIKTNIKTNKVEQTKAFHLIESYEIIESSRVKDRMVRLEITLSDWFYNSIVGKEVLTINRDYFRLGKALERRLYEIARKHCSNKKEWKIGLKNLKSRTGSTAPERKFRFFINQITRNNYLPGYLIDIQDDIITFKNRDNISHTLHNVSDVSQISSQTMKRAKDLVIKAGTGWDLCAIVEQFYSFMESKEPPNNINGAFIGFVKNKISRRP